MRSFSRVGLAQAAAIVAAVAALALPCSARAQAGPNASPSEDADAQYASHMSNGVKLFESGDFKAALVEFEAAYSEVNRPGPLINQALCYQKLGRYPKAVERLTLALDKHFDAMTAEDRAGAQAAVQEMKALFAYLTFAVSPSEASVLVDGELVSTKAASEGYAVGPGEHEIVISAPRHVSVSKRVVLASSQRQAVEVALVPERGRLSVVALKPTTVIKIDGKAMAKGSLDLELPAGQHRLELVGETGTGTIDVAPGAPVEIDLPRGKSSLPALPKQAKPKAPPNKRGLYGAINGAVLFPTKDPDLLQGDTTGGGYVGVRGGYRVHNFAAFEGMFEYGNVQGPADPEPGQESIYSLSSFRVGPVLRLMSPGELIHFVGTVGGGFAIHLMDYEDPNLEAASRICSGARTSCGSNGLDIFVMTELGAEIDFDGVLIGASFALVLSGTKGMEDDPTTTADSEILRRARVPYDNEILPSLGPRVHFGYAFW